MATEVGAGMETKLTYTVDELASALSVHPVTIRRHIDKGKIRHVRLGGCVRVPASEVKRLLTPRGTVNGKSKD